MNKRSTAASLAMLALTASFQLRAENIASVSVSFSGLSYELIDLDLDDGIDPSITFTGGKFHFLATDDYYAERPYQSLPGTLFSAATGQDDMRFSQVGFGAGGLVASALIDGNAVVDVSVPLDPEGSTGRPLVVATYAEVVNSYIEEAVLDRPNFYFYGLPSATPWSSFTLTPNTRLVVKARVQTDLLVNFDALGEGALRDAVQQGLVDAEVSASGGIELGFYDEAGTELDLLGYGPSVGQILDMDGVRFTESTTSGNTIQDAFETELSFVNDSANAKNGGIYARLQANASLGLGVAAVPEPSTYALMGLGLVGLAAVARKGRLNKPH